VAKPKSKFTDLFKNRNLLLVYLMVFCSLFGFFVILTVAALLPAKRARHCGQRNRLYHLAGRLDLNPLARCSSPRSPTVWVNVSR
jgi:hypothetical protein